MRRFDLLFPLKVQNLEGAIVVEMMTAASLMSEVSPQAPRRAGVAVFYLNRFERVTA
jgi:hypothetical protein